MNVDLFCKQEGVTRQVSEARNQASNGKAERMHRTVLNMARCMVFASNLPLCYWGDAVEYSTYILNRSPTRSNASRASPIEVLTGQVPDLRGIVVFGSQCTVYRDPRKNSLQRRAQVGTILGKSDVTKGYKVYLRNENVVVVTQHVANIETLTKEQNLMLQSSMTESGCVERMHSEGVDERDPLITTEEAAFTPRNKTNLPSEVVDKVPQAHIKPKMTKKAWSRPRHVTRSVTKESGVSEEQKETTPDVVNHVYESDPQSYNEAMKSPRRDGWINAINEELTALESNGVWTIIPRPKDCKILHSKWVFKTKTDTNGEISRLKARLVACGNEQVFGVDYLMTFAAVMEISTVKVILALAITWGVPAKHGDIPNAYVKANKEEHLDIFLSVPVGMEISEETLRSFRVQSPKNLVLRLQKSLYGLKQAGRLWS